jgi:two-component system response regulator NreC
MTSVVIADDHEIVRQGFALIINAQKDMQVVGTAADGNEAYRVTSKLKPDVLLLDISMPPGENGLVTCEKIARDFPDTRIIMLTMFEEVDYLFYTLRGGASGYILKNSSTDVLLAGIRKVAAGGVYIEPSMAADLTEKLHDGAIGEKDPYQALSNRELEVFSLLAQGYTNKEIAGKIFISVKTVEAHRSKIYSKLGITTRAELVHIALKHHLRDL